MIAPVQNHFSAKFVAGFASFLLVLGHASTLQAGSATWIANPHVDDWQVVSNWLPMTVPNGPNDTATFSTSSLTNIFLSAPTEVNGIVFTAGAANFTITPNLQPLTISGVGVTNDSGVQQSFAVGAPGNSTSGLLSFTGTSTAGSSTVISNAASPTAGGGGSTSFFDNAGAGEAIISDLGYPAAGAAGATRFYDSSTAANATMFVYGGPSYGSVSFEDNSSAADAVIEAEPAPVPGFSGGLVNFTGASSAGQASITLKGGTMAGAAGGFATFGVNSNAGSATFVGEMPQVTGAGGGSVLLTGNAGAGSATFTLSGDGSPEAGALTLTGDATGDTSRIILHGGYVSLSGRLIGDLTFGSLEGEAGYFNMGGHNVFIGSTNTSTTYGGILHSEGPGVLFKTGKGTFTLTGANDLSRGIVVQDGTLLINNRQGSGSGRGSVQVNAGTLGGSGKVTGDVTIGDGLTRGGILAPGPTATSFRPFTTLGKLTFKSDGSYRYGLNSARGQSDKAIANGVSIDASAKFVADDRSSASLAPGTVLLAIDNTAATPISGTFSNLADGALITIGSNSFQANYEGGDGNDLTLTVVP